MLRFVQAFLCPFFFSFYTHPSPFGKIGKIMGLHADLGRRDYAEYKDLDHYQRILSMATGSIAVRFHLLLRQLLRRAFLFRRLLWHALVFHLRIRRRRLWRWRLRRLHQPGSYFGWCGVVIRCSHGRLGMGGMGYESIRSMPWKASYL